jgi:hypothetical protein
VQHARYHPMNSMTVPAQRHAQVECRKQLLAGMLPAIRQCLTDHPLLDITVCELVADYMQEPHLYRKAFIPEVVGPEEGQSFPTTVSKFSGADSQQQCVAAALYWPSQLR